MLSYPLMCLRTHCEFILGLKSQTKLPPIPVYSIKGAILLALLYILNPVHMAKPIFMSIGMLIYVRLLCGSHWECEIMCVAAWARCLTVGGRG